MRSNTLKSVLIKSGLAASAVLLAGAAFGQQQINLSAGPATVALPDGTTVPMWGYSCGAVVTGSTATCAALNPAATASTAVWSPVVITVPTGQDLQINLTNNLSFTPTGGTTPNTIPTSLVIVGQVGGGLGVLAQRTTTPSPDHSLAQGTTTWPIAGNSGSVATNPPQGARVQSFSTEVAAGATTSLTWTAPLPGTYLIESGTHPSLQGPMGLYGILVVTTAPAGTTAGTAYPAAGTTPAVTYDADIAMLLSEIDPVQNNAVNAAVNTAGFSETMVWSGQPGGCGNPTSSTFHQCYPPAVNYIPLYYLINGVAFDSTHPSASLFASSPAIATPPLTGTATGSVLVRLVNAGLRMHVPSIVGSQTGTAVAPALPPAGFSLIAEDGNLLPGVPRVQSEVFMAAGKTYDVMINGPAAGAPALPIYDRELSLSANATARDAGMLAYIGVNGGGLPAAAKTAVANPDTYNALIAGKTLIISDPSKGLIANDINVNGVQLLSAPSGGTLTLNADGTFTYVPNAGTTADAFTYCANGTVTGTTCSSGLTATVTLAAAPLEAAAGITVNPDAYTSNVATSLSIKAPGVLANDTDGANYPLTVAVTPAGAPSVTVTLTPASGTTGTGSVTLDAHGGFNATVSAAGTYTFTYQAQNSQNTVSAGTATVTLTFLAASNLAVTVLDGFDKTTHITDYRWIIEEDRTFVINPACTTNPPAAGCPTAASGIVPTFGTNFHTSYMPVVATGCTGPLSCEGGQTQAGANVVCDIGNGICRPDPTGNGQTPLMPGQVHLDATKRYYLSILPGDAANPFNNGYLSAPVCQSAVISGVQTSVPNGSCGHGMGGAPIAAGQAAVTVLTQPTPFPPAKLSVFVFEDDFPLNGEQDVGGGIDVLAPNEPGLGGFNITLFDDAGGTGDSTGQMTYDMFNQPLSNSLGGQKDPLTGKDACPISPVSRIGPQLDANGNPIPNTLDPTQTGITGTIVTCPRFESDGITLSPLAGQAVIANMMPGRYGVVATPGADRIARGEEWLQTNTLDGQKAHDSFLRIGEPSFFQEFGPAGYHVSIGFANPAIINARKAGVCAGTDLNVTGTNCTNTVTGLVTTERMSRTPDQRLYSSGDNSSFAFTQCYVSLGDTDGEDFAFTKCNADGSFTLTGIPQGNWRVTVFDQWNDMLVDGLSTPVGIPNGAGQTVNMGQIAMNQWQANIYTNTFFDANGNGVRDSNETGLTLVATNNRFRDGSFSNFNNTDLSGNAGFNEIFPLFSWYVIETDSTRYKNTGTHVVYDAGGPADGTNCGPPTTAPCGSSAIASMLANTAEQVSLPTNLRVPGAVYCAGADCAGHSIAAGPASSDPPSVCTTNSTGAVTSCSTQLSTGRIDPPWVTSEGWQGFSGQNQFIEFGKKPFAVGENGGIRGHVIYASTRPFDDPQLLLQTSWEPLVPGVTINLYQEGTAADGSVSLRLVDTTKTSSWDVWAQGFRSDGIPNMNCPGQGTNTGVAGDLFFFTLFNQPMWLDFYNNVLHGTAGTATALPNNAQFKCYDGMHNWNQVQPAPYDGMYQFPSIADRNPVTGVAIGGTGSVVGTNCAVCVANPTDGTPMLPNGKYVVEVVVPPGYELVKEEDKNILIGDNYIAPVTVQFPGLATAIYIVPDQASVASVYNANQGSLSAYNANNPNNPTQALGRILSLPSHEGDTGSVESFWPCVGAARIVPDFISLYPQSLEVAPFAGATRNLCDRKEVQLDDQTSVLAKFYVFTSTHAAAHFTGVITDDFTSEFDPFSPQFGEKFSPPNMPIAIKDWAGNEISRVYSDQWGTYNGLTYSTWEVNPPNPTGYGPTMMVTCMNDPGNAATPDPLFNPQYSQFCYEIPFMPAATQYMDTPVVPTSAFAGAGYNNPDCDYPNLTPAISEVDGDGTGPWVSAAGTGHPLTIHALGDKTVFNYGYSGPSATTAPFNQKTVTRHYGFGATQGTVTVGGNSVPISSWSDTQIVITLPATGSSQVPLCAIQQQAIYAPGATPARCGQLVVTAANGQKSIDAVTITVGGKAPVRVGPTRANTTIQAGLDVAAPGDLLLVDPGVYNEILLMWKPVRLQGAGAASTIVNANTHPAGKLDPWRARVNCLLGLALNGQPLNEGSPISFPDGSPMLKTNPFDATGAQTCPTTPNWTAFTAGPNNPQVDRIPLEGIVGWDVTLNGNLAELLQEPTLMGAYEGAGITVLAKGVRYPANTNVFGVGNDSAANANIAHEGQMPLNTLPLFASDCLSGGSNPFPSNFQCNPSRIDGLSVTDSSQGGGGMYVHGWGHNLEISNNRIYNNTGTLTGGITVGQGESPDALLAGNEGDPIGLDQQPWTCLPGAIVNGTQNPNPTGTVTNQQLPFCYDTSVNVHNNAVTRNSSIGDELFSSTPAGAGGVTFCTGSDYYKFNNNWVCGNLSTGDGGGLAQLGFVWNGDIEHNQILFNQSTNPTVPTNGGGMIVMGAAPDGLTGETGLECGSVTDVDCAPGLSDGSGPGLVINANLLMGNGADSGSGGGIRLQSINGTEVANFPAGPTAQGGATPSPGWNAVLVTNNIVVNNVAGWDGAGVSLQDALVVNFINNTVMSNDSTASSGVLFNTLGAPLSSAPGAPPGQQTTSTTTSAPQVAGFVTMPNSSNLIAALPATTTVVCPPNHGSGGTGAGGRTNGNCRAYSVPLLDNDIFWQNRTFYIGVGPLGGNTQNQQNVVSLFNSFSGTAPTGQTSTGQCVSGTSNWDIGVRGDTGPSNHGSGLTLTPRFSIITDVADYPGNGNIGGNPAVVSQYCNGSRIPPEASCTNGLGTSIPCGFQVPPGIADATVPNPIFALTPSATVDEGNNWINISWGPLAETNPATGAVLGNYAITAGSPAINLIVSTGVTYAEAPTLDFFGRARKTNNAVDAGAVEFVSGTAPTLASIAPNEGARGTTVNVTLTGTNLLGATAVSVSGTGVTVSNVQSVSATSVTATFTIAATAGLTTRNVQVTTPVGASNTVTFTIINPPLPTLASVSPNSGVRGTAVPVTLTGTNFTTGTTVTVSGAGVTVSALNVLSPTQITATFTITTTAGLTARNVIVHTPGGNSNAQTFTVTGATLTSLSPATGLHNTTVPVTLTGTSLTGATGLNAVGGGITVTNFAVVNSTTVTANLVIANGAAHTTRNISVATPIGNTNTRPFTVQ